jgi:glycosyltransferase involved in cell wall biosynthesis
MRIGFFTDAYLPQPNGVATAVETSASALEKLGHEVYIIAPKHPGYKDKRPRVYRLTSIKVDNHAGTRLAINLPERALASVLRIKFDVIHGHSGGPVTFLGWEIARMKNIPYVVTYHTLWNRYTHYILKGTIVRPRMIETASRFFCNLCEAVIAPTNRVRKELLSYGVKKPIFVIPNGLDTSKLTLTTNGYLKRKLRLGKETKIVLYVGRLGKEKSVDFLLESFKILAKVNKDAHLVLVGDGPDRMQLQELAKQLKIDRRTSFVGLVPAKDMPKVYSDADVFVFASQTETQGLVIPEALVCGVPVVAVEDEAFEGVVSQGQNGFLVSKSKTKFANQVQSILESEELRKRLSQTARRQARKFSAHVTARDLEGIYKEVITNYKGILGSKRLTTKIKDLKNYLSITRGVSKIKNIITSYSYWR